MVVVRRVVETAVRVGLGQWMPEKGNVGLVFGTLGANRPRLTMGDRRINKPINCEQDL